ncbi:glycoside hydrolase family 30 glucosylceramidase [Plasmopara halstedii]|uniref:Glycoside hydrolase family 30 glucosylceramidase n=1 Tax=Plasmopara halstedii TaxID=4781 RepID=A0A0P1AYG7_PLAHL|nr:glycoside hydrolase family 30 glucosylceramidase [Plasmopara halstedii]CEG46626.1 glycoside hydrolase family 30 glucosylceramidase [Plasmopara halstedii]|eukprot:XP_024582995.1 glycoside hydrolase family 30 glucosylceramidase [Plasmopara halstedii]
MLLSPYEVSAACFDWSSLHRRKLDGVCVCNVTHCDSVVGDYKSLKQGEVGIYTTSKAGDRLSYRVVKIDASPKNDYTYSIEVSTQYQTMLGFGGAFTDAASINLYRLMPKLQDLALAQYFSKDGIQYNMARVPIGSTDFSKRTYTYNDKAGDFKMTNFSIAVDKAPFSNKIDMIKRALNMTELKLFASSWAPPLWLTKGDSVIDCEMRGMPGDKHWAALALYYSKFFDAYKEEGINFWGMTVQNEPEMPPLPLVPWESLRLTPEDERDFVKLNLGPLMAQKYPHMKIMANDDQKTTLLDRSAPFDDPESKKYLSGLAFHWYKNIDFTLPGAGNYDDLVEFHKTHPDMFMLATEACAGYLPKFIGTGKGPALYNSKKAWKRAQNYARDIIENSNHMAAGWVDWNLFLDTRGGPNWAKNMVDAPILIDGQNGAEFYKQPMYYIMGHFSKFVPPGSRRIEFPKTETLDGFHRCAFVTPDNQIVMQFLNRDDDDALISILQTDLNTFTLTVAAHSMQTVILPASEKTKIL